MSTTTKYILLRHIRMDVCVIRPIDSIIDAIVFSDNGIIHGFSFTNDIVETITGIVCLHDINVNASTKLDLSKHIKYIGDFQAHDINELVIKFELEGYVVELDHQPTSINDLISNGGHCELTKKDQLIASLSEQVASLQNENNNLHLYIDEMKARLSAFNDILTIYENNYTKK